MTETTKISQQTIAAAAIFIGMWPRTTIVSNENNITYKLYLVARVLPQSPQRRRTRDVGHDSNPAKDDTKCAEDWPRYTAGRPIDVVETEFEIIILLPGRNKNNLQL